MVQRRKAQLTQLRPLAQTIRMLIERKDRCARQLVDAQAAASAACEKRDRLLQSLQAISSELEAAKAQAKVGSPVRAGMQ
eukprot:14157305-Alexandrium_andersonii.AAC.1